MKVLDIAGKDILRSFRSLFFIAFGFLIPLLIPGLFYLAFGGAGGGGGGTFDLPATKVQVVNMDKGSPQAGSFVAGNILVDFLKSEPMASLVQVTDAADAASARAAVDRQEAGVAMVIPEGFTMAVISSTGGTAVELYQDPTLTIGPAVVKAIVSQFVDAFSGAWIAGDVTAAQFTQHNAPWRAAVGQAVFSGYTAWAQKLGSAQTLLAVRSPAGTADPNRTLVASILGLSVAGMLVFYAFFTGAASAMAILQEEESGTLPRLFTTPTPQAAILGGKFLAILANLVTQVVVLLIASALIFGLNWGRPLPLVVVAGSLIIVAASFGIFVTSLLKNTRQTGIIYGGVMTVMGMLGMISVFAVGSTNAATMDTVALFVPQGWGVHALRIVLQGGSVGDVLPYVAVMLGLASIFFVIGLLRFRKRFAQSM
jgi:ABC-type Na+ efflux pump permease subunit